MNDRAEFKRVEFEVEARCIHCGALLFSEMAADEPDESGGLIEVERRVTGATAGPPKCKCRS